MTADQYTELIDFLTGEFGQIDGRFDALERRFDLVEGRFDRLEERVVRVEVGLEALRHDVQILGEGLAATNERLDRYHQDHELRIRALEDRWLGHLAVQTRPQTKPNVRPTLPPANRRRPLRPLAPRTG